MTTIITGTTLTSGYQLTADSTGTLTIQTGSGPTTAMYINSSQNVGIGSDNSAAGPNLWPSAVLHSRAQAITAAAPNLGWPYYISPESDANAKLVAIFDTGGNGAVQTAGYGATAVVRIGSYYDSRALITPTGSGGSGPSDQSTGSGKDLMVKGGQSDNTNGKLGGRLFLNGGSGYFGGAYGATGYYGDVIIQGHGTGNVGINTTVMNVYDAVAVNRPLVVARSDTSTSSIGSAASITISNLDTTTSNVSQINFAAITGANANHFSSAIISAIHGARTNGQYPTGQLTFSTSTSLNSAPSEKLRITNVGTVQYSNAYASSFHVDTTPASISVATSGTIDIGSTTIPFSGMVVVNSYTTGGVTIYLCGGGSVTVVSSVIGQVGTMTYVSGNNGYRWTNNTALAVTVGMFIVRTRTNA